MKKLLITALVSVAAFSAGAADVGVSISVGEPGFYGRIDIGNAYPQPQLIYREPVVIHRAPSMGRPIYLHVPPGHAKNWGKHCGKYNACGQPVYFVQDRWYNDVYVPRHGGAREHGEPDRREHGDGPGNGPGNGHGNGHGHKEHGRKDR
jgi:hypothetical protein